MIKTQQEENFLGRYSTFQIVPNTLGEVVERLLKNDRLLRLLYYTDRHALSLPTLTTEQIHTVLDNSIKIVPRVPVDRDAKPYVVISIDKLVPSPNQTTFLYGVLSFDIICNFDYWLLDNYLLRPWAIAGEINGLVNKSQFTDLGMADFSNARQLVLSDEIGGVSLNYIIEAFTDDIKLNPATPNLDIRREGPDVPPNRRKYTGGVPPFTTKGGRPIRT